MFGETTIFYVMIWNHPVETTIKNWLFGVPGNNHFSSHFFRFQLFRTSGGFKSSFIINSNYGPGSKVNFVKQLPKGKGLKK